MHAISSYHDNRDTYTQTDTSTHRQDRLQYTAPQLASAQCKNLAFSYLQRFFLGRHTEDPT